MPDAPHIPKTNAIRPANEVGQESLEELFGLSADLQARILEEIDGLPPIMAAERARVIIAEYEPLFAELLSDAVVEAWITASASVVEKLPAIPAETRPPWSPPPPIPPAPPAGNLLPDGFEPLRERLPVIENAVADLAARKLVTRDTFDTLAGEAKAAAFTVSGLATVEAVGRIREAVTEAAATGATQQEFNAAVKEAFGQSPFSEARMETIFRTNVMEGYSRGLEQTLDHPLVGFQFPYVRYVAVHDARARAEHRAMETYGLDGGPVYRMEDPTFRKFRPPWSFNCRCGIIPLSIEQAADMGVSEAIAWRDTGRPPLQPQYVQPPPFEPEFQR